MLVQFIAPIFVKLHCFEKKESMHVSNCVAASPKKSAPLRAGAGLERAAMSLKAKREEREMKDG